MESFYLMQAILNAAFEHCNLTAFSIQMQLKTGHKKGYNNFVNIHVDASFFNIILKK